jgi:hypothetical protein
MLILGTAMPDSSKPAVAIVLLTRWLTNNDDKEEDELNYAPLPHLSPFSSSSPSSPPRSLFSCPASSALSATVAAAALLFRGGCHCRHCWGPQRRHHDHRRHRWPVRAAERGGRRRTWGVTAPGDRCARRQCHQPPTPLARAWESGTATPAAHHCDGRPPPRPLPPCPRWGWTNRSALFPIVPVPVPPPIDPTIVPPIHSPLPSSPLPQ